MSGHMLKRPLLAMAAFNLVDYCLSLYCFSQGFYEANPLMRPLVGTPWFFTIKVIMVPLGLYWVWCLRRHVRALGTFFIWSVSGIYALLMAYYAVLFLSGLVRFT